MRLPWLSGLCERAEAFASALVTPDLAGFERRLDMARLYWDLRWLGDRPEWIALEKTRLRFENLAARPGDWD